MREYYKHGVTMSEVAQKTIAQVVKDPEGQRCGGREGGGLGLLPTYTCMHWAWHCAMTTDMRSLLLQP